MANLLEVVGSVIPLGTIIKAVGPPDSSWLQCDGSILNQSAYPGYVSECDELHPLIWKDWLWEDVDQSVTGTTKYAIDRIGDLVVCVGSGSTVWVSTDGGETWATNTNLSVGTHYVLANDGTRFVTARYGSTEGYYSTDGVTWSPVTLPSSLNWRFLTYANGYFVLMPSGYTSGTMSYAYSTDGTSWSTGTFATGNGYVSFLSSDGSEHSCFYYSSGNFYKIHTSTNGSTWSSGTTDFFHGSPYYNDDFPSGLFYLNGEYVMFWGNENLWYLKYEGSDIKEQTDWYRYPWFTKGAGFYYFDTTYAIWTGSHIVIPNAYSSEDGIMVGHDMDSLALHRTPFAGCNGIVNDGEDWIVCIPATSGWNSVIRSVGVNYTKATQFQLPLEIVPDHAGIYSYIKVMEG